MSFFEVEFPRTVSFKAIGGPGFNTTVNEGFSGFEQRNRNWSLSRAKYTIDLMTPPPSSFTGTRQQFIDYINSFFLVVGGKADAFRFWDHRDNTATAQQIGIGDGSTRTFQLVKNYTSGGRTYTRTIKKPITSAVNNYKGAALTNTVVTYIGGVAQPTANWSADSTTGLVTFGSGHAPANLAVVSADCQFHIPVRFDSDDWQVSVEESDVAGGNSIASVTSIALVEVRI